MANDKTLSGGLVWTVRVAGDSSMQVVPESDGLVRWVWLGLMGLILGLKLKVCNLGKKVWTLGSDEPRKVVHCVKVGLALTMVSLFYYMRPLYNGVGGTAMWSVMTVVVVFEYSVGATLAKGLNRGMGTLFAGSLAIGIHSIASKFGDKGEPVILGTSLFLLASVATFSRFLPTVKARYDYGVMIFILTYSLVSVSGYRVENLFELAHERLATIALGCSMCFLISIFIWPIWSGQDLHLLVTRNMEKVADSLDGSVAEYFRDEDNDSKIEEPSPQLQAYKCVLNSKTMEESLANFARWEPSHGSFSFRHPWKQYLKIGAMTRYCAYCVGTLNSCINSEIQSPLFMRNHLSTVCMRLSSHSSSVLRELATTTKAMNKPSNIDFLVEDMNNAAEELQSCLKTLPNQLTKTTTEGTNVEKSKQQPTTTTTTTNMSLLELLPLVTVASQLIEITARIEGVVDAVKELGEMADFKPTIDENLKEQQQGQQEAMQGPQLV